MRLIDADKILYTKTTIQGEGTYNMATQSYIENMPEIKAIPIDWLLNKLLEDDHIEMHHAICCLWEMWKEENEI